jgi:hypothetical protein
LLDKAALVRAILHPEWVEGGPGRPGPPQLSPAATHCLLAGLVRDIAAGVSDSGVAEDLRAVGRKMAERAADGLVAGWEEGDELCPPWRWPFPPRGPLPDPWLSRLTVFGPLPDPWLKRPDARAQDVMMGIALLQIAPLMPDEELGGHLKDLGGQLAG